MPDIPEVPAWLQAWLKTVSLWDLAIWITVVVVAFWLVRRFITKGWPALKRFASRLSAFIHTVDAVVGLPAFIERTDATLAAQDGKIAEIHHEVNYNNGSSVKDSARRIETGVAGLYERVDGIDVSLAGVHGRLDDVDRQISELRTADGEIRERQEQLRHDFDDTHPRSEIYPPREKDTP